MNPSIILSSLSASGRHEIRSLLGSSLEIIHHIPLIALFAAFSLSLPSGCTPGLNLHCFYTSMGVVNTASQTCTQSGSADIIFSGSFCPSKSGYYAFWLSGSATIYSGTHLTINGTSVGTLNAKINLSLSNKLCYSLLSDIPQMNSVTSTIYFQYYSGDSQIVSLNETSSCYSYFCQNSLSPPNCGPNATSIFTSCSHSSSFGILSYC